MGQARSEVRWTTEIHSLNILQMGGIYLRVWTEASKIIFEGMLHCGQLKKNEMTGSLSSTLTVRVIPKRRGRGRGGWASFHV
jgi:hypothetical protein